jgi:hypothetical protein
MALQWGLIAPIARPREQSFQNTRKPNLGLSMTTMDWQDALQEAIHDSDPQIMDEKIRAAEMAIFARMSSRPNSLEEQALFDALGAVRILRSARRLSK